MDCEEIPLLSNHASIRSEGAVAASRLRVYILKARRGTRQSMPLSYLLAKIGPRDAAATHIPPGEARRYV